MAFEGLSERLQKVFSTLKGKGKLSDEDIRKVMREVRMALLEADVNFDVVKSFVKTVRERALGAEVMDSLTPSQQVIKIVDEELTKLMGQEAVPLNKSAHIPTIIMMVGLQGAGKTTTAGKLANYLKNDKKARPLFIAGDVYRPAAVEQLKTIGQQLDVPVYDEGTEHDPVDIVRNGLKVADENKNDYVIIDTAGRLEIDEQLMEELTRIKELAHPDEILFVADSMTGQVAAKVAAGFDEQLDITGVVLTKLDGDTRGGAALSIRSVTGKPIKFIGQGEKLDQLDVFHPDRMANRILGMGDMLTLIEKAQSDYDEKQAKEVAEKIRENSFDFNDFIDQMDQIQKMGPLDEIMKMIPGMANNPALANINIGEKDIAHLKAIVYSMTPKEREDPDLLNPSRRRRIAKGSGQSIQNVNRMIKQFKQSRDMMNKMSKGNMAGMDQLMGNGMQGRLGKMAMHSMVRKSKKRKKKRLKKIKRFKS
ncbi:MULTISPECIES: signal recognition particle protein [Companilactobacillus]|uniref:Signal recognition particle protein n=4 Tax=Companilactobacillus TaxID=2767879 RepID=A0ABR5NQB8_9LACO|nr:MULTISPECIES: signal recognition particle protein [Companilactobacillus]GEO46734.1 signal recognition particle protein [Companilactobacillus paralimentarius]KAE9558385.1 signal recognition particle [Companilactobacillus bobalius]KAE9562820.1 signal recognition particle [Companilactobacillus kimchii]KRK49852.1 signal recognition particle protein [Companilactobacillus kimchii DSM 13961 = JCM 10707]KRK83656.1 signal recognition particle protein [Companilactobacillus bobalius DSM 19674]